MPPRSRYPIKWARNRQPSPPPVAFPGPHLSGPRQQQQRGVERRSARSRRYALVGSAAVAAVLTPPDAVSMLMMLVPLYGLYEFALLSIRLTHWRAARRSTASDPAIVPAAVMEESQTCVGPETPPGGGRVGGSGPI